MERCQTEGSVVNIHTIAHNHYIYLLVYHSNQLRNVSHQTTLVIMPHVETSITNQLGKVRLTEEQYLACFGVILLQI